MLVRDLRVRGWRNLADERLALENRVTVLFGRNGQGKTNFIEAIYYAVTFRSFRTNGTAELIKWGSTDTSIEVRMTLGGLDRTLAVRFAEGKKSTTLDGKAVRRDSKALDGAGVVVFGPEDLRLPKAAGSDRRRALDRAVFAVQRTYFREAATYEKVLRARNVLLRKGNFSEELLESYDETMAQAGARIVARRREVTAKLSSRFADAFEEIHGELKASIRYRSHEGVEAAGTEAEVSEAIRRGLAGQRKVDERRGFTSYGPHTDDLEMMLGGRQAREHGSQGQLRSLMLAFKFAELGYVEEGNKEAPLFLLDDVASELDERRRSRLFEAISATACQTVLTVTERELLPGLPGRADWEVSGGSVQRL